MFQVKFVKTTCIYSRFPIDSHSLLISIVSLLVEQANNFHVLFGTTLPSLSWVSFSSVTIFIRDPISVIFAFNVSKNITVTKFVGFNRNSSVKIAFL